MKVLIIFLSLLFVGCVTAKKRDLSAPKTDPLKSEPVSNTSRKLAGFNECVEECLEDRLPKGGGCRADCRAKLDTERNRELCNLGGYRIFIPFAWGTDRCIPLRQIDMICINRCKPESKIFKPIENSCLRDCS